MNAKQLLKQASIKVEVRQLLKQAAVRTKRIKLKEQLISKLT